MSGPLQLQLTRPEVTLDDLRQSAYLPYITWLTGRTSAVQFGDLKLLNYDAKEDQWKASATELGIVLSNDGLEMILLMKDLFNPSQESLRWNLFFPDPKPSGKLGEAVTKVDDFFSAKNNLARKITAISNGVVWASSSNGMGSASCCGRSGHRPGTSMTLPMT